MKTKNAKTQKIIMKTLTAVNIFISTSMSMLAEFEIIFPFNSGRKEFLYQINR
ncbi:MAG: hypothetical protein HY064_02315 [Bacteroidetes bacterium]|nr:hypothetical protein [Bacteroidota bacterium]